jgi:hypothetical protein
MTLKPASFSVKTRLQSRRRESTNLISLHSNKN